MGLDEIQDPFLDVRPDRGPFQCARGLPSQVAGRLTQHRHVFDRNYDRDVDGLGRGRLHDGHRPPAAQERRHFFDRTHGGREPDSLGGYVEQGVQSLEGQREVGSALGGAHRVHLVDDDGVHPPQRFPGLGGQQEKQRFGRGDEDVGGSAGEPAPFIGRRVTGSGRHADVWFRLAEADGGLSDAGQR